LIEKLHEMATKPVKELAAAVADQRAHKAAKEAADASGSPAWPDIYDSVYDATYGPFYEEAYSLIEKVYGISEATEDLPAKIADQRANNVAQEEADAATTVWRKTYHRVYKETYDQFYDEALEQALLRLRH
jgi:hypothetical protein